MLFLLFALQVNAVPPARSASFADSVATHLRLRDEASDFLGAWRVYWQATEAMHHAVNGGVFTRSRDPRSTELRRSPKLMYMHCHPDRDGGFVPQTTMIRDDNTTLRAVCPSWPLED